MINYIGLKEWLLKSVNLHKDHSGQVYIERVVDKPGILPFTQRFWITPTKVKDNDKVILNHHNLPKGHTLRPANVRTPGSAQSYPPEIKQQTANYFKKFKTVEECFDCLNTQGITWDETTKTGKPLTDSMRIMRAKMALNAAIFNGYIPVDPTVTPKPQTKPVSKPQTKSVSKPQTKSVSKPQTKLATDSVKVPRNYDSVVCKDLGMDHYDAMRNFLDKVSEEFHNVKELWAANEYKMTTKVGQEQGTFLKKNQTEYFINLGRLPALAKGNWEGDSWSEMFHEGGHLIDYTSGTNLLMLPHSCTYNNGEFVKAIHEDVNELLKPYNLDNYEYKFSEEVYQKSFTFNQKKSQLLDELCIRYKAGDDVWFTQQGIPKPTIDLKALQEIMGDFAEQAFKTAVTQPVVDKLMTEFKQKKQPDIDLKKKLIRFRREYSGVHKYREICDIIAGMTNGNYMINPSHSHPVSYWESKNQMSFGGVSSEAFAEITAAILSNDTESLKVIQTHLPRTYSVYHKIIESLRGES